MKKSKLFLVAVGAVFLFTGCAGSLANIFKGPTPQQIISQSQDPYLTKGFLNYFKKHKPNFVTVDYEPSYIKIEDDISDQVGTMTGNVAQAINIYMNRYSNLDYIAKLYIKLANQRGDTVKMYKTFVNAKIARILPVYGTDYQGVPVRFNLDDCFIEYNKNGLIVSALVRTHFFYHSIGWLHYRDNFIVFGRLARLIENRIPNGVLQEGYITSFKPKSNKK